MAVYLSGELHFSGRKGKGFQQWEWDNGWSVELTRDLNRFENAELIQMTLKIANDVNDFQLIGKEEFLIDYRGLGTEDAAAYSLLRKQLVMDAWTLGHILPISHQSHGG